MFLPTRSTSKRTHAQNVARLLARVSSIKKDDNTSTSIAIQPTLPLPNLNWQPDLFSSEVPNHDGL